MRLVLDVQSQPEALSRLNTLRRMGQQLGADLIGFDGGAQHLGLAGGPHQAGECDCTHGT